MSEVTQIPAAVHDLVTNLFGVCKRAALELDEKDAELEKLKQASTSPGGVGPTFTLDEAQVWAGQLKQASLVDERVDLDKLARHIVDNPSWLVEQLIQHQLPPEPQGVPEKQASTISDGPKLVDHDGWLKCL